MEFIETVIFTQQIEKLSNLDDYKKLQQFLIRNPESGTSLGANLHKIRWNLKKGGIKTGKRGGIRVLYIWIEDFEEFYMIVAYAKSEIDNITTKELASFKQLASKIKKLRKKNKF